MEKKYTLKVRKQRVEVTKEIYKAYYQEREHEKYLEKKALYHEYSFEGMVREGINFEHKTVSAPLSPEEVLIREMEQEAVREAVLLLTEAERELIHLYYYENKTERQIAEITGINHVTVNKRKLAILKKLKKLLKEQKA